MRSTDLLTWLGERRDGFLVGGAVLYGLGYLVWSYNAWRNHLGQLPALEFQYLMAGLIPAFIIAIAWAAATYFSNLRDKTLALFEKYKFLRWASVVVICGIQLPISFGLLAADWGWINLGWTKEELTKYTAPLIGIVVYLSLLTSFTSRHDKPSRLFVLVYLVYQYGIPALFCWYSLVVYLDLYPRLPNELGGPEPRCAYVDLVRKEIAPSSLSVLVPACATGTAAGSESKVVRSIKLRVYFASSDYLLVRTGTDGKMGSGTDVKEVPLYELRKEVIRAIQWCRE